MASGNNVGVDSLALEDAKGSSIILIALLKITMNSEFQNDG
jgi:hypothetical protein